MPVDRLAYILAPMVALCVAGVVYTATLVLGWFGWGAVALSAVAGLMSLPLGWTIADRIRRNDPDWPPNRQRREAK